jgi:hypothetical protein
MTFLTALHLPSSSFSSSSSSSSSSSGGGGSGEGSDDRVEPTKTSPLSPALIAPPQTSSHIVLVALVICLLLLEYSLISSTAKVICSVGRMLSVHSSSILNTGDGGDINISSNNNSNNNNNDIYNFNSNNYSNANNETPSLLPDTISRIRETTTKELKENGFYVRSNPLSDPEQKKKILRQSLNHSIIKKAISDSALRAWLEKRNAYLLEVIEASFSSSSTTSSPFSLLVALLNLCLHPRESLSTVAFLSLRILTGIVFSTPPHPFRQSSFLFVLFVYHTLTSPYSHVRRSALSFFDYLCFHSSDISSSSSSSSSSSVGSSLSSSLSSSSSSVRVFGTSGGDMGKCVSFTFH